MKLKFEQFGNAWPPRRQPSRQQFSATEKLKLEEGFDVALECSALAVDAADKDFKRSERLLQTFFARPEDLARVKAGLQKMHAFLSDPGRTITFVDARGQSEKLLRFCERAVPGVPGRHGAIESVLQSTTVAPMTAGDYAYVKTIERNPEASTESHSGSGMRIYIGERGFHPSKTVRDTAATVYHEVNHKVLGTTDYAYKVPDCADLATTDSAVQCADSWALFVTAYKFTWPDLDWDPRELIETRPRSNAISRGTPAPASIPGRPRSNAVIGSHRTK